MSHVRVGARARLASAAVIFLAAVGLSGCDASAAPTNEVFQFPSAELAGNLLGLSAEITVGVLLPAAYFTSDEPLPVVYYLPGYSSRGTAADMPRLLGDALDASPMIVVTVTGANELGGGWYTDSPVTGNWEQAIVTEIVPYIDSKYRTVASADARGIAGHSMGGYGALTLAMRHADVFGSVFVEEPAVAGEDGVGSADLFGSDARARTVIAAIAALEGLSGSALVAAMADFDGFEFSYGTAFAPSAEPPYFKYPYTLVDGRVVRDDDVWAEWEAGFGSVSSEVAAGRSALMSLSAMGIDCGSNDEFRWIFEGCGYLDASLSEAGVPHVYSVHSGNHGSRLAERLAEVMVPFFADAFAGAGGV
ncbi:alpha/beta hydrolase [Demequina lutea]|uniref:S-formylglutathione hydrolase FrmB n=1 Tax=Demequina lutea TaxID=431489 RepID=A0A7Z0CKA5_9MICO|nr:alpha/beta hydrolase-fold protein [Demequina lutea]NYI41698.1 S-formylglutathione hydrolase FrmB [Demequina lutea]